MKRVLAAIIVLLQIPSNASAYADGNELFEWCNSKSLHTQGLCLGYINGAAHGLFWGSYNSEELYCLPPTSRYSQVQDVVKNYLLNNPEKRHTQSLIIIKDALQQAFPCK